MPWIRFWAEVRCGSGLTEPETTHLGWFEVLPSEEMLKISAEEHAPGWMRDTERGFKVGFEVLDPLPEDIRNRLIKRYEREKEYADKMLAVLLENGAPTRFERIRESPSASLGESERSAAASSPFPALGSRPSQSKSARRSPRSSR